MSSRAPIVRVPHAPQDVNEGPKGRKTQRYEAKSPREAAEIVAKLNYLMLLQGGSRTQRLADDDPPPSMPTAGFGWGTGLTNRRNSG